MKRLIILITMFGTLGLQGQTFYSNLYGFRLGQYRQAARLELGKPFQYGKFEDGYIFEAFLLKPDTSLYIIFEYAARDTNIIWSIQVSGHNPKVNLGLNDAKLGMPKTDIERLFGKPTLKEDIGEYGQKWVYNKANYSLEMNIDGVLSSIKILDNSHELFPSPDQSLIPTFAAIRKTLTTGNNAEILSLLSGDMELYKGNKTFFLKKSFKTEQATDYSKVLAMIRNLARDLSTVDTTNTSEYEENMRLSLGDDIKHVIKIKKGHAIKEIVLKYYGGKYVIYEIYASGK